MSLPKCAAAGLPTRLVRAGGADRVDIARRRSIPRLERWQTLLGGVEWRLAASPGHRARWLRPARRPEWARQAVLARRVSPPYSSLQSHHIRDWPRPAADYPLSNL